jgi:hypothetical protein
MKGHKGGFPSTIFPDDHSVAMLGHELGNVLNGLLGMAELLGDSGLSAEQDRWLTAIEHSGRQMQSLISTVRFIEGGAGLNIVPRKRRADGMELLEQVIISHTPAARLRNYRLILVMEPGLPRHWYCDACLVRQLLDNLVGNAIKFTCAGKLSSKWHLYLALGIQAKCSSSESPTRDRGWEPWLKNRFSERISEAPPLTVTAPETVAWVCLFAAKSSWP